MNSPNKSCRNLPATAAIAGVVWALGMCLFLAVTGCTTVTPEQVHAQQWSFDGTNQNSGLIEFLPDGSAHLTAHARDRYNALISVYSKKFLPALVPDAGVVPQGDGTFVMDPQHLNYFKAMNRWKKEGKQ